MHDKSKSDTRLEKARQKDLQINKQALENNISELGSQFVLDSRFQYSEVKKYNFKEESKTLFIN